MPSVNRINAAHKSAGLFRIAKTLDRIPLTGARGSDVEPTTSATLTVTANHSLPTRNLLLVRSRSTQFLLPFVGVLWIGGFLWFFFTEPLPNVSASAVGMEQGDDGDAHGMSRAEIWRAFYPGWHSLPNPLDFDTSQAANVDSGGKYLTQRLPFVFTAGLLLLAAFSMGLLITDRLLVGIEVMRCERLVIQTGTGLSALSLWVLIAGRAGWLSPWVILLPGIVSFPTWLLLRCRSLSVLKAGTGMAAGARHNRTPVILAGCTLAPFVVMLILGAMTPPWDFDVREYHMQGPKEWFQNGRITFLEHNVYTSFPFLSEMLSLAAMVVHGDWRDGAISGKLLLATFPLLTTLCVFATANRWFGRTAGLVAAIVYLTTPWTFRISIIAYAEGALTFCLIAAVMTAQLAAHEAARNVRGDAYRLWFITGLLAGSAMAAKYPGVLSVVMPVGLFLLLTTLRLSSPAASHDASAETNGPTSAQIRTAVRCSLLYASAILIAVGPWLAKNAIDSGNPVYPLLYGVFGGVDWNSELNARWKAGHSPADHDISQLPRYIADVAARSDWTSGLLFALAVPSLLLWRRRPAVRWLWLMTFWMLGTWWALTHRIDRFWIPVIPVLAVSAGASWQVFRGWPGRAVVITALAICCVFNLGFWKIPRLAGFQAGLMDLTALQQETIRQDFRLLNRMIPQDGRALMVGEAEVFDADFDVVYNTVFDENIFEKWTELPDDASSPARTRFMADPRAVLTKLSEHGITHVVVNWSEILRYRQPGSYGYTEYVQPRRFNELVSNGVLTEPATLTYGDWNHLSPADQDEILSWDDGSSLVVNTAWTAIQVYRVVRVSDAPGKRTFASP